MLRTGGDGIITADGDDGLPIMGGEDGFQRQLVIWFGDGNQAVAY